MSIEIIVPIAYAIIAAIVGGVTYELQVRDGDDPFIAFPIGAFWGLIVAVFVGYGAIWGALWIGRGPYLLVEAALRRRNQPKLPEARAVDGDEYERRELP